jgi:hypothetical protein
MNKRPGAETNGKGESNGKGELNGKGLHIRVEPTRRQLTRTPVRRSPLSWPVILVLCLIALTGTVLMIVSQEATIVRAPQASPVPPAEAFRLAVNRAISAAELTQKAATQEEWKAIADWWQEAVDLMQRVPRSNPNYAVAQSRIPAYQRNLQYAKRKAAQAPVSSVSPLLWTKDFRRADVIRAQGEPSQTERYDALCKEVLYFGKSTVELKNGIVVRYEDADRNLKAVVGQSPLMAVANDTTWTLDSLKDEVFRIQGTPTRVIRYDSSQADVLYYGNSLVYLLNDRVVGYNNLDNNLYVQVVPTGGSSQLVNAWTIDSPRDDLLKVQGTPTQVNLDQSSCSETLQYGLSSIELRNGFVAGYNDLDNNLKVKVQ